MANYSEHVLNGPGSQLVEAEATAGLTASKTLLERWLDCLRNYLDSETLSFSLARPDEVNRILNSLAVTEVPDVACAWTRSWRSSVVEEHFFSGSYGGDVTSLASRSRLEYKICWYLYNPARGDGHWQIAPGAQCAELSEHWICPNCDGAKRGSLLLDEEG